MLKTRRMVGRRALVLTAAATGAALLLGACGSGSDSGSDSGSAKAGDLNVVVSFYPLQYVTSRVLGDGAEVTSLTKPGAEPHDLELTPQDVAEVSKADLVIYVAGFQTAVDDAVAKEGSDHALDVAPQADLSRTITPMKKNPSDPQPAAKTDPHFWLDPLRLADVSDAVAAQLETLDPEHAEQYKTNAAAVRKDLEALDTEYKTGLANCTDHTIVTSHTAFGYLADRYGLSQLGISGLSPETEPTPAQLAAAAEFVRANNVTTIYYETLVSPKIAETVAKETGAKVAVLDPIEGLNDDSDGSNYIEVAQSNLTSLKTGLKCS
jgi:zinc transport system substrate-binding protein